MDWKRASLGPATRDAIELTTPRGRVTQAHPLRQARDHLVERLSASLADVTRQFAGSDSPR